MKRRIWLVLVLAIGLWGQPAAAQGLLGGLLSTVGSTLSSLTSPQPGVIVRTNLGRAGLQNACSLNGCTVVGNIDGNLNQVFLVRPVQGLLPNLLAGVLRLVTGILDAEPDQTLVIPPNPTSQSTYQQRASRPLGHDAGELLREHGYRRLRQSAGDANHPDLDQAQDNFNVSGAGIVADIDTGVDPNHPAFQGVLLQGYDFTRNQPGGSEMNDISMSAPPPCSSCPAAYVNQHTAAMLDQHTAAMLDGSQYEAFGHGTMVMGVIHLVAPTAKLLPVKAFSANGNGSLSNIIAGIYYAVQNHANVINMSFDLLQNSTELTDAINYANSNHVILVASSGNDGVQEMVYPAGLQRRDGRRLHQQSGPAIELLELRKPDRVGRRSRRRRDHHLPVRPLRRRLGNVVQFALRRWNGRPCLEHAVAGHSEPGVVGHLACAVRWAQHGLRPSQRLLDVVRDESSSGSASVGAERRSDADDGQHAG